MLLRQKEIGVYVEACLFACRQTFKNVIYPSAGATAIAPIAAPKLLTRVRAAPHHYSYRIEQSYILASGIPRELGALKLERFLTNAPWLRIAASTMMVWPEMGIPLGSVGFVAFNNKSMIAQRSAAGRRDPRIVATICDWLNLPAISCHAFLTC